MSPDELWNEVRDIVQETGIKTIPMEKKCKKGKWLSEEALQIAMKIREAKSQGEKEKYKHLNAEFQRRAILQYSGLLTVVATMLLLGQILPLPVKKAALHKSR